MTLIRDSHFTVEKRAGALYCVCTRDWDTPDVERLKTALQPLIDGDDKPRFVMDLLDMEEITLGARWLTSSWMRNNRGKVERTAVILRDSMQRFVLQTLLRVSGRTNVKACADQAEAFAFVGGLGSGDAGGSRPEIQ